jgi:WD40 repeat protein
MAPKLLTDLPADVVHYIVVRLTLAHDIALAAPTCHVVSDAARNAFKVRPFSGEVVTLAGHTDSVGCVAAAPDGRVISGSFDGIIKLWRDGKCERTIQVHTEEVNAVAVLPGGARFVSVSGDKTAKLWTLGGTFERTFDVGRRVFCFAALPDGVHFVVGLGYPCEVRLYHVDGTLVHTFCSYWDDESLGHDDDVLAMAVTPDGQHIISGSKDKLVKVWSVASKSLVSTCTGHTGTVWAVAAMPDGQRILSGADDFTVRVWLLDGTLKKTFSELHADEVECLVALPDNQHALSGSQDKTVKLFDVNDGTVLRTINHHTSPVFSLALLPDGLRFVSGSWDKTARIAYHGLSFAPAPAYLASEEETLKTRLEAECRRHEEEVRQIEAELANIQLRRGAHGL